MHNCERFGQLQYVRAAETFKSSHRPMGKMLTHLLCFSLAQLRMTHRSTTVGTCRRDLESSHRPDGKMADALASTLACATANASVNSSGYVPQRPSKVPIARMGISHVLFLCLQGGGVLIGSGTVTFLSCTVTGNTAYNVHAHAQTSHRPDGRLTFCSLFAGRRCLCRGRLSDL